MKKNLKGIMFIVGLTVLLYVSVHYLSQEERGTGVQNAGLVADFKSVTFRINGEAFTLENGTVILPLAPDSANVRTIKYFGNELAHDIDGDGDLDMLFLVTDEGGATGTFFYLVGAINTGDRYVGTPAVFLGDRIAPQSIDPGAGTQVIVNYAERSLGDPMSTPPSVGKSMYVQFDSNTMNFDEVVQNFGSASGGKSDLIVVTSPTSGALVDNPITVTGEARGYWFFEGSFTMVVVDWDGRIIGEGYATAEGEWMTEDFVPFTGTVSYDVPADTPSMRGAIIFKKDNPSGLPENDDTVEIPVELAKEKPTDHTGILPFDSGVYGTVLRGPICPVMQNPPQPECDDQPFDTTVQVIAKYSTNSAPFATAKTNAKGEYSFQLPPGEYVLQAVSGKPFPSCQSQTITVQPKVMQEVVLSCDTGIR